MSRRLLIHVAVIAIGLLAAGCPGEADPDGGPRLADAGAPRDGGPDGGRVDAGEEGVEDAGPRRREAAQRGVVTGGSVQASSASYRLRLSAGPPMGRAAGAVRAAQLGPAAVQR